MDGRLDPDEVLLELGGRVEALRQEASRRGLVPPAGLKFDGDPEKATTGDWVLDPEAWCGWPYIHGPHGGPTDPEDPGDPVSSTDGRLCSGVLWTTVWTDGEKK